MFESTKQLAFRSVPSLGGWLLERADLSTYIDERAKDAMRKDFMLAHGMAHGYPSFKYAFVPEIVADEQDIVIARRLLAAYQKSVVEATVDGREDLWTRMAQSTHREFIEVLRQDDPTTLAGYLCNMHTREVTHGLSQGAVAEPLGIRDRRPESDMLQVRATSWA